MMAMGEVRVRLSLDGKLLGRRGQAAKIRRMLEDGALKRLHVTFVPRIVGGADSPTLLGVPADSLLQKSVPLRLERMRPTRSGCEAVYAVAGRGKFASSGNQASLKAKRCKRATRKIS
jgi:hypothetical protein